MIDAAISCRYARKVKEQLEMSGCRLLGCVLNKIDVQGKRSTTAAMREWRVKTVKII